MGGQGLVCSDNSMIATVYLHESIRRRDGAPSPRKLNYSRVLAEKLSQLYQGRRTWDGPK